MEPPSAVSDAGSHRPDAEPNPDRDEPESKNTVGLAVSVLNDSMRLLHRMEALQIDDEEEIDLDPEKVNALVAESLGLDRPDDAKVCALMRESMAVAERLAAAALQTPDGARRRLQYRALQFQQNNTNNEDGDGYVPPRALLLYLVRMGSFSSALRVANPDSEDDDLELPIVSGVAAGSQVLLAWCARQLAGTPAKLLTRRMVAVNPRSLSPPPPPPVHPTTPPANIIRVMQWNVLSQALGVHTDHFVRCPAGALCWPVRRALLLQELVRLLPDVICLQEVDHFRLLERALGPLGYRGLWEPKPDSPCLYISDNNGPDGCALLWRTDKLSLVRSHRAALHVWRIPSNQVALLAGLRHQATGQELLVATTHLKARPGALMASLRNEQAKDLLRVVSAHSEGQPVVLAGDFNASPSEPLYRTMLQHPLELRSVYAQDPQDLEAGVEYADPVSQSAQSEPPYTTWKVREEGEQCHTIDYLFVSKGAFSVRTLLEFPAGEDIGEGRVPSYQYPSDHFSLCADLEIKADDTSARLTTPIYPPSRAAAQRTKC